MNSCFTRISAGLLLIVACSFLSPSVVWAEDGKALVDRGRILYQRGEFQEAYNNLKNSLSVLSDSKDKAEAYLLMGVVHLAQDNSELAKEEFVTAVELNPERVLAPRNFRPGVIKLYNQARSSILGSIIIQTTPSDAWIYIDGVRKGLSPLPVDNILAGVHKLKVVKENYGIENRNINVNPSERTEFFLELKITDEQPATIEHKPVRTGSEGSSIRITVEAQDNIGVAEVQLHFRKTGNSEYEHIKMRKVRKGVYEGVIPPVRVTSAGIQYYVTALDSGGSTTFKSSPDDPVDVRVHELDKDPPKLFHTPVIASSDASKLIIKTKIIDNLGLKSATLYYRRAVEQKYIRQSMAEAGPTGSYVGTVPEIFMTAKEIQYYIEAEDNSGNIQYSGRAESPHVVKMFRVLSRRDGYVVERKGKGRSISKIVTINVGSMKGYKKDQTLYVFVDDDKVVDPETGMILRINQKLLGKVKITLLGPASSQAKVAKEVDRGAITTGSLIRFRPGAPTNVKGSSEKFRRIMLSWNESQEPEVMGYTIYRSSSEDGSFLEVGKTRGKERTEYLDKGSRKSKIEDRKKYYYKVRAYNGEKEKSDFSKTGFVVAKGGPNPPNNLLAESGVVREIPLTWQTSQDKESKGYEILRAEARDGKYTKIAQIKSVEGGRFVDKPNSKSGYLLEDGKPYWYKMTSFNKTGSRGNATEPVAASSRQKPKFPANFHVVTASVRSVSLAWNRSPDPEVTGYRIYRNIKPEGKFHPIKNISDRSMTEYVDKDKSGKNIHDGIEYFYRITAINSGGAESRLSNPASGITFGPPSPPLDVTATSGLVKQVTISWEPAGDPEVTGYAIYRGETADNIEPVKRINDNAISRFQDKGRWRNTLKDGTEYYYMVKSLNSVDVESIVNKMVRAKTKPVPVKPAGAGATQGDAGKTVITWDRNPESDIAGYRILRSTSADGKPQTIATVKETSYEDLGLKNGASYYYIIQAIDADGLIGENSDSITVGTKHIPITPKGLEITAGLTSVTLSWEQNPEPDIAHYVVYSTGFFGKQKVGTTTRNAYVIEGLDPNTAYSYVVTAIDEAGLSSKPSSTANVKTLK